MQKVASGYTTLDVEVMNLWCAEGLRSIKLQEIQQLKFTNPVIESEFRRALDVLALSHDSQKKAVSVHFAGEGKRRVRVGYVIEAPIWKTSYRLVLAEKEKPYLQGWAMVENPTDEDLSGVQMALISGRPISFKMDLYNPLYINRPVVEPELFASLRPVTYRGGFDNLPQAPRVGTAVGGGLESAPEPGADAEFVGRSGATKGKLVKEGGGNRSPERPVPSEPVPNERFALDFAYDMGQRIVTGSVGNAATASALGDFFQYTIDHPVNLARQKSALLPIVGKAIEGLRISIYNQSVQARHPLLGMKFKNTTGLHLNQGPITVFEGSVYAGDSRILDVQPNEERIVSYAIDQGMEIDPQLSAPAQKITSIKAVKGIVTTHMKNTEEKTYRIINRGQTDRTLLIEHPNRTNQFFKLIDTEKPIEDTPELYRFQTSVKAGETKSFRVKEEKESAFNVALSDKENQFHYFLSLTEASPILKKKLSEALAFKEKWNSAHEELNHTVNELKRLSEDQDRIRKNLRETPKEAEVYQVYLKKLSDQEKEIDELTARQKKLVAEDFAAQKKFEEFIASLSD